MPTGRAVYREGLTASKSSNHGLLFVLSHKSKKNNSTSSSQHSRVLPKREPVTMATAVGVNPASWWGGGAMELSVGAERQKKFAMSPEEEEKWIVGGGKITLLR